MGFNHWSHQKKIEGHYLIKDQQQTHPKTSLRNDCRHSLTTCFS
jgi:hypothetical protein